MLRLPGKNNLDFRIMEMLKGGCETVVEVPTRDDGRMVAFICESLQSINDVTLILGIEQERTDAGRGIVRGLWYDKPVVVWMNDGLKKLRIVAFPYRCHIVGSVFSTVYDEIKKNNPEAEVSVVWELVVDECKVTSACPPTPVLQTPDGEIEYHLDHPSLM